jgi:hypothetical protein
MGGHRRSLQEPVVDLTEVVEASVLRAPIMISTERARSE